MRDPYSLRYRVLALVVAVVLLPLVWVWSAGAFESVRAYALRRTLYSAVVQARASGPGIASGAGGPERWERISRDKQAWLRVVEPDGTEHSFDHAPKDGVLSPVSDPFYAPAGRPALIDIDRTALPLEQRAELSLPMGVCHIQGQGLLLVCSVAVVGADGTVYHAMRGSPRLVRSLYEERFQLAALTLAVLSVSVLLALGIGVRMVRPIESLRDQVVARTRGRSTEPVVLNRADELGELATAFNELLAALADQNKANAIFAADLAHELKNPVAAVRSATEALNANVPLDRARLDRLGRVLTEASRRMDFVVHQFLELARAESGLPGAERETLALDALCQGLITTCREDPQYQEVRFVLVGAAPVMVSAVSERLGTAVRNLLVNAAVFAGPGGTVSLLVTDRGERAVISVRDNGPGIDADLLPLVFSRYRSSREGGTGLGLAMAKAIALAHGGSIDVQSLAGQGATFRIALPKAPADPQFDTSK